MFKIKNVSENKISVGDIYIYPNDELEVEDLKPFEKLIQLKYITVLNVKKLESDYKFSNTKKEIIESFFNYHLNSMSYNDIKIIADFYKYIGFTRDIDKDTLSLLDDVKNAEELVEVMLNSIYPALIDLYLGGE